MPQLLKANRYHRRDFLKALGIGAAGIAVSSTLLNSRRVFAQAQVPASSGRQLRGLFPIGSTPYTEDDKLDLECLGNEVKFCNKGGVHGFVWPQIASGWTALKEDERLAGAEAILSTGKGGKTALVIGVQTQDGNMATVEKYAKHAAKNGADAIVSLPPPDVSDEKALLEYYQAVGKMTDLPLFVQTQNEMSVDLVVQIFNSIPTARYVKDEAAANGGPLQRISEIRKRTNDQMKVFSGQGVRTMITEMELGFSGHCPYVALADLYASAFDLFHAGKKEEAFAMFGRIQAFGTLGLSTNGNPIMVARGMFKPTTRSRNAAGAAGTAGADGGGAGAGGRRGGRRGGGGGGAGGPQRTPAEETEAIRKALDDYLKPYLRA